MRGTEVNGTAGVSARTFDTGKVRVEIRGGEGELLASFSVDPGDTGLAARAGEAMENIAKAGRDAGNMTVEALDELLEREVMRTLGKGSQSDPGADDDIFRVVRPTAISADGELFAAAVLAAAADAVLPEMKKRQERMAEAARRYTEKYAKDCAKAQSSDFIGDSQ